MPVQQELPKSREPTPADGEEISKVPVFSVRQANEMFAFPKLQEELLNFVWRREMLSTSPPGDLLAGKGLQKAQEGELWAEQRSGVTSGAAGSSCRNTGLGQGKGSLRHLRAKGAWDTSFLMQSDISRAGQKSLFSLQTVQIWMKKFFLEEQHILLGRCG